MSEELLFAVYAGNSENIDHLLNTDDPNWRDRIDGDSPLFAAACRFLDTGKEVYLQIAKLLIEAGAELIRSNTCSSVEDYAGNDTEKKPRLLLWTDTYNKSTEKRKEHPENTIPRPLRHLFQQYNIDFNDLFSLEDNNKKEVINMIMAFKRCSFDLIVYFHKTPGFSVRNLLRFNPRVIRDLGIEKSNGFLEWLQIHQLNLPKKITSGDPGMTISSLANRSGIEYLKRTVLAQNNTTETRQAALEEVFKGTEMAKEKEIVLQDSLSSIQNGFWNTTEDRFNRFVGEYKQREQKAARQIGINNIWSLQWQAARKVATTQTTGEVPKVATTQTTGEVPEGIKDIIRAVEPFPYSYSI